ncbi:MAG TPA: multicopper oxidase domain-containing protein [Candidatus Eisenbacteria bacterium]|jgi:FtsP/CotA-like multicopper oxidase with cupredoxin domain
MSGRKSGFGRRDFLRVGALAPLAWVAGARAGKGAEKAAGAPPPPMAHSMAHAAGTVGEIAFDGREPVDPFHYLTAFNACEFPAHRNWHRATPRPGGTTLREYEIAAYDKEIEIAPGIYFPAWTYNGQVPGPTIRAREGDAIRIHFVNQGSHPHTMHFHGFHHANMDGVFEIVPPGGEFTYEFDAEPAGLHLYHCHSVPLKRHIHKGLYGVFLVDPREPRPPARELVMMMNGFDTDFDSENDVYAVNSIAFHHMRKPIRVVRNELVRIYLVNILEFDLLNSFHIHGHFFDVYRTGTRSAPDAYTDTVQLVQAERAVLELRFKFPGQFMFHAHQSEFAELGWMGLFEVTDEPAA